MILSLKADLLGQGWSEVDITQALTESGSKIVPSATPSAPAATPSQPTAQNPATILNQPPKAPVLLIVIAWIMLLFGILGILAGGFTFLIGIAGGSTLLFLLGAIGLIRYVLWIAVSIGIRHMRRWAYYVFIISLVLSIAGGVVGYFLAGKGLFEDVVVATIGFLILIYFWSIRKLFR